MLRNEGALLPLQRLDTLRLATVKLRAQPDAPDRVDFSWPLPQEVAAYAPASFFTGFKAQNTRMLWARNLLLLALPDGPATSRAALRRLLALGKKTVVVVFDSTALTALPELRQATAVVLARVRSYQAVSQAVQVIFGGISAAGRLSTPLSGFEPGLPTRGGGLACAPTCRCSSIR